MSAQPHELPLLNPLDSQRTRLLGTVSVNAVTGPLPLPLTAVAISARVAARIAQIVVCQTFHNPHKEFLEAIYIFPLPSTAVVSGFEMSVGGRAITGKIAERRSAVDRYKEAVAQCRHAALLEQERDDVFTVRVGNLPPGEEVSVRLTFSEPLCYFADGSTELRLPLVVAPRYVPGNIIDGNPSGAGVEDDTDLVPDAARITPPRLMEGYDSRASLAIDVEIITPKGQSSAVGSLCCSQHAIVVSATESSMNISLARTDELLNRDFVLRWRSATDQLRSRLLVHKNEQGEAFGMLSLLPPAAPPAPQSARDIVFVLDRSLPMAGAKLAAAVDACTQMLAALTPGDRFTMLAFEKNLQWLLPEHRTNRRDYFIDADEAGIERGRKFLRSITAQGCSDLYHALGHAFDAAHAQPRARPALVVVITSGHIGDDARVVELVRRRAGEVRLFTFGVDSVVNEGLLRRLARLGRGTASFIVPGTRSREELIRFCRELGRPLLVDLAITDGAVARARPLPDLFAGRAVTAFFRIEGQGPFLLCGRYPDGREFHQEIEAEIVNLPAIAHLWARASIMELEDRMRWQPHCQDELQRAMVELSIDHHVLCHATALIAVETASAPHNGKGRKVVQPVAMPAQWAIGGSALKVSAGQLAAGKAAVAGAMTSLALEKGNVLLRAINRVLAILGWYKETEKSGQTGYQRLAYPLSDFDELLLDAKNELALGCRPNGVLLERARVKLLQAISECDAETELPALYCFLSIGAVELITAVNLAAYTVDALVPLFERHYRDYLHVRGQVVDKIISG